MLLTILIPTRNRRKRVRPLVASLVANLPRDMRNRIEILVLDNCSVDGTAEALAKYASDGVRIHVNEIFLPTSEQNIVNGVQYARGEFIWFLGDDDVPRYRAVHRLLRILTEDPADLLISNCRVRDGVGRLVTASQIRGLTKDVDIDLLTLVKRVGVINMLAGLSVLVVRRSMLDGHIAHEIIATSAIYSHCFWLLRCYKNASTRLLTDPLVDYRVFSQTGGWDRYAEENGVGYLHFWHLGLLRLFQKSINDGVVTPLDVSEIFECRSDGTPYREVDEIVHKLIEQTDYYVKTGLSRNLITRAEFDEACGILLNIDLGLQDTMFEIGEMLETLWRAQGSREQLTDALSEYATMRAKSLDLLISRSSDPFGSAYQKTAHGYAIYMAGHHWVGVRHDVKHLTELVMAQFEPRSMYPGVIVRASQDELLQAISYAPVLLEPFGRVPLAGTAIPRSTQQPLSSEAETEFDSEGRQLRNELGARIVEPGKSLSEPVIGALWLPRVAKTGASLPVKLVLGWSDYEVDGVWSIGDGAVLSVHPPLGATEVAMTFIAFAKPDERRRYRIRTDRENICEVEADHGEEVIVTVPIPANGESFPVYLQYASVGSPADLYGSADKRHLGLFLRRVLGRAGAMGQLAQTVA